MAANSSKCMGVDAFKVDGCLVGVRKPLRRSLTRILPLLSSVDWWSTAELT